jgi:hypothetical protein
MNFRWLAGLFAPALADYRYASHTGNNQYLYTSWETVTGSANAPVDAAGPRDTACLASRELVAGEPFGPWLIQKRACFSAKCRYNTYEVLIFQHVVTLKSPNLCF